LNLIVFSTAAHRTRPAAPAQALNDVSYVSANGSGTDCSRTIPCTNFQVGHDATLGGGEIACPDSGRRNRVEPF
jgi:hypothetical protein